MAITEQALVDLFRQMTSVATGATRLAPGQGGDVRITAPAGGLGVTEMLTRTLSLEWVGKNVRFFTPNPLPAPLGSALRTPGEIVRQVVTLPILRDILQRLVPGTGGGLGQLAGSFQTPIDKPVFPTYSWRWQVKDAGGALVDEGEGFLSGHGLTVPETSFVFRPPVRSFESPDFAPQTFTVTGGVRVTFGTIDTGWLDFPEIPFLVEPLRLPTLLAMFVNPNFQALAEDTEGAVLAMVPGASPLHALTPLINSLSAMAAPLQALGSLVSIAPLATAVPALTAPLASPLHSVMAVQDAIGNLNDWTLIQRSIFENDTEAEDEISSVFLVGVPGTTVRFYNARNFGESEGVLELRTGPEGYALIRDLDAPLPVTEPPGRAVAVVPSPWNSFRDTFSSVRYTELP